ncbi:PfkB family carbohydrate kinase [Proteiniclasticum sp. C24MP]|uniref:PfkB family carbohydrate kinase n=1 Tax=Proteiniclasticum sp. C24MP TaxID=3374101 RepID=UPI003754FE74
MIIITQRELEIIEIIRINPFVSQQEIADLLNITRSSVAVHITNLVKKGIIRGRGYVIDERDHVSVIGGANVDIVGYPFDELRKSDSNPGEVNVSIGGVGRNIAENLAKLGNHTKMFTVVGEDVHGDKIISESEASGIDMSHVSRVSAYGTGTYLAVLNRENDMDVAIASMNIFQKLDRKYIDDNRQIISKSKVIVFDTNLEEDVLQYAVQLFKDNVLFLDTVSHTKALRAKKIIGYFHTIKPNRIEAEALSGIKISGKPDLEKAAKFFHEQGVVNVFITLGEEGVFYSNGRSSGLMKAKRIIPKNATGAGDAFQAALVHAELKEMSIEEKTRFSMAASILAMSAHTTINPEMSVMKIEEIMKNMEEK